MFTIAEDYDLQVEKEYILISLIRDKSIGLQLPLLLISKHAKSPYTL